MTHTERLGGGGEEDELSLDEVGQVLNWFRLHVSYARKREAYSSRFRGQTSSIQ